jgi:hypothetical protein
MVTIEDNRKTEREVNDLDIGDYFMYEGDLYVVIAEAVEMENVRDDYYDSDVMNVLELRSGALYHIHEETLVNPVDVKIIIS